MIDWSLYEKRLNINGSDKRERDINILKQSLINKLPDNPSVKSVTINGVDRLIEFVKTDKGNIKIIHSLPNETFNFGEYLIYGNHCFLINKIDIDNEMYTTGKIELCNYTLKFQNAQTGEILSYPCVVTDTTIGSGLGETKTILLSNSRFGLQLPLDENTKDLKIDKRFLIDLSGEKTPDVYKITDRNVISENYGELGGITDLTIAKDLFNDSTDNRELMIANYFEPIETPIQSNPNILILSKTVADNNIIFDSSNIFESIVTNELDEIIKVTDLKYSVDNNYNGAINLVNNLNGTCTVNIKEDYGLITKQFELSCIDTISGYSGNILLTVVGYF